MPRMQSAYRRFHSTETAVTEVFNDLLVAADGGKTSPLCLLDLTATFDEVDHQLLLLRLKRRGVVLEWFKSHLSGRVVSCRVRRPSVVRCLHIVFSVPQFSVLFGGSCIDVADQYDVICKRLSWRHTSVFTLSSRRPGVNRPTGTVHLRSLPLDGRQTPQARLAAMDRIEEKSFFSSKAVLSQCYNLVRSGNIQRPRSFAGSNDFNTDLGLYRHVPNTGSSGFYWWLRQLQRVRRSLDMDSVTTLVHSFAPKAVTDKLQRVLNAAAGVVCGIHKYDQGLLRLYHSDLHWFDVPEQVAYKLGVIAQFYARPSTIVGLLDRSLSTSLWCLIEAAY